MKTTIFDAVGETPNVRARLAAAVGWRVIPLVGNTKRAALKEWPKIATTDIDQIDEWFAAGNPEWDVGIVTGPESNLWVLDIDVKAGHGADGLTTLNSLIPDEGLHCEFAVKTPSGGLHMYFSYPDEQRLAGGKVMNISGDPKRLGPGLDVRGWHGLVVAPWAAGRPVISDVFPLSPAPEWLVSKVIRLGGPEGQLAELSEKLSGVKRHKSHETLRRLEKMLSDAPQGTRNDTLNKIAYMVGHLVGRGLLEGHIASYVEVKTSIWNVWGDRDRDEFQMTWKSGVEAGRLDAQIEQSGSEAS